jgi:deoxyribodipyrimidine photo-lyase
MKSSQIAAPIIVWFRQDLRLADNPALTAALKGGGPVIPLYIWAPEEEGEWPPGGASKWWLHQSLRVLQSALAKAGSRLILRRGPTLQTLREILSEFSGAGVFWNRRYEPVVRDRDAAIKNALQEENYIVESFNAALLHEPWTISNKAGKPFQVFTPFWRHCLTLPEPAEPLLSPARIPRPARWPISDPLERFQLSPVPDWAGGLRERWQPGESGAGNQLAVFLREAFENYVEGRNRPAAPGTSRLSPHLHHGEISPRQIWHSLRKLDLSGWRSSQFVSELGWREFSHHLLYYFPKTPTEPLRAEFSRMRWRRNHQWLEAWQRGRTGYPLVDAGMRELWATGWMHNRVRMVVASFLVKDLLIGWQEGARWFWDTLVDADLAQNTMGWQWVAGCGADAAPFFRIFNPVNQGEKFDPEGLYIRRWIPELAALPDEWVNKPHLAPPPVLERAQIQLGRDYPQPLVSHAIAREIALEAYQKIK